MSKCFDKIEKYDLVIAKSSLKILPGRMNIYNQHVHHKKFSGIGLVIGASKSFCSVYLTSHQIRLFKNDELMILIKYKHD